MDVWPGILSCSAASTHLQGGRDGSQVTGAKALRVGSELFHFLCSAPLQHWHLQPGGQQFSSSRGQNRHWHRPGPILRATARGVLAPFGCRAGLYPAVSLETAHAPWHQWTLPWWRFVPQRKNGWCRKNGSTWLKLKYALGWLWETSQSPGLFQTASFAFCRKLASLCVLFRASWWPKW